MDENPGLSDQYRMASPWPMFVALGLPIAEIGVLFDLFALTVGGMLLFFGSIAGMLTESGYTSTPWRTLAGFALLLFGLGAGLAFTELALVTRGYAVITAAAVMLLVSVVGHLYSDAMAGAP